MRNELRLELLKRLIDMRSGRGPQIEPARRDLPAELYTSEQRFAAESEALFRREPILFCHSSELSAPGAYVSADIGGIPLVAIRGDDAEVRVFANACRHRGARIVGAPCGVSRVFQCPYHGWSYDRQGKLQGLPFRGTFEGLEPVELGLLELPSQERHGFVWTRARGGNSIDMAAFLGAAIDDDFEHFDFASWHLHRTDVAERDCNWKLIMDAFAEGFHVSVLHRSSLARFFLTDCVLLDPYAPHARHCGARVSLQELPDRPESEWDLMEHATLFYNIFPNVVFVFHPDWVSQVSLFPVAVDRVRTVHRMLIPRAPGSEKARAHFDKSHALIYKHVFEQEDFAIAENIQSALPAMEGRSFVAGGFERGLALFHDAVQNAIERMDERLARLRSRE
jgi:phenylpropionate dioxygenase-like ring-hydroxylating dioxygenase large terminal subunit